MRSTPLTVLSVSLIAAVAFSIPRVDGGDEGESNRSVDDRMPEAGMQAPDFEIKSTSGKTVHLKDYRGKVVLLHFWFTTCGACTSSLQSLKENVDGVRKSFGDDHLVVIGVCADRDPEAFKKWIADKDLRWIHVCDGEGFEGDLVKLYHVRAYPSDFVIDGEGTIRNWDPNSLLRITDEVANKHPQKEPKVLNDALLEAAGEGRIPAGGNRTEMVKALLVKGADPNAVGMGRISALSSAAFYGRADLAETLIAAGADVNARDSSDATALLMASLRGHPKVVKLLLKSGADVNAGPRDSVTPFSYAAWQGHTEIVKLLRDAGAVYTLDLPLAAALGDINTVKKLLDDGVDVNQEDRFKRTGLFGAVARGHKEIISLLISKGADVNAGTGNGKPLFCALDPETVRLLVAKGGDVNEKRKTDGMTALMWAALDGRVDVVEALIASGADVNARSLNGGTALRAATGTVGGREKSKQVVARIVDLLKAAGATE